MKPCTLIVLMRLVCACFVLGCSGAAEAGSLDLDPPAMPIDPKPADCREFWAKRQKLQQQLTQTWIECSETGPEPGSGPLGFSWVRDWRGDTTLSAYPHCQPIQNQMMLFGEETSRLLAECHAKAGEGSSREARMQRHLKKLNDSVDRLEQIISLINDPRKFLSEVLDAHLVDSLLPSNGNYGDAEEIYRLVTDSVNRGLHADSPVVGAIQRESFELLEQHFSNLMVEAELVGATIRDFKVSEARPAAPVVQRPVAPVPPASGIDCSVIHDPARGARLLAVDPDAWQRLLDACHAGR